MRNIIYLFIVSLLFLSCGGGGVKPPEITDKVSVGLGLHVMPFHKTTLLAGKISIVPRLYEFFDDGSKGNIDIFVTNAKFYLGGKIIGESYEKPIMLKGDVIYEKNGVYPFKVVTVATDGKKYEFATNVTISNVSLTVKIKMKEPKPEGMEIYLAGSASVLVKKGMSTEWNATALKMKKINDLEYSATFKAGLNETVFMEFTLGSWATKARDEKNELIHTSTVVKKDGQVFNVAIDNWGKTIGKTSIEGWNIGFTGDGKNLTFTYSQKNEKPNQINYAFAGEKFVSKSFSNTQYYSFDFPAKWGSELLINIQGQKATNSFILPKKGLPFTFLKVGDIHCNATTVIPALMAKETNIAFVMDTGDLVMDGLKAADWNSYYSLNRCYLKKFLYQPAMGNHEYESPFFNYITGKPKWYSFTWENTYFICLDNNNNIETGSPQVKWLEGELKKAAKYKFRIVYMHIPPYSSKKHGDDEMIQTHLVPLFDKYGVNLVFCGHEHGYEVSYPMKANKKADKGTIYVISAGGGQFLYDVEKESEWSRIDKRTFNYMRVTVYSDKIILNAIDDKGVVFDTFEVK
jgi:predicted MPP superfamily phosphohydrolase